VACYAVALQHGVVSVQQPIAYHVDAGNDETAEVLALIEEGVPLHWSRDGHEFFPDSFRHKVQPGFVSKHRGNV
jgi:hypothetical protein